MERYQVILAYDGSEFQGFQRQAHVRTVQGVVETALRQLGWQGKTLLAAGRTDTGVHASGQVVAFDLDWAHTPQVLQQALNAHLPRDVSARTVELAAQDFHPRYSATARRYCYYVYCQPVRDPLMERYAWRVWPPADLNTLAQGATHLLGRHDFAAFGTPPQPKGSTVRSVLAAGWKEQAPSLKEHAPFLVFEITAHAFLYHMVRRLVYIQVLIGQGRLQPQTLLQALGPGSAGPPIYGLAPAHGLVLAEVFYTPQAAV